MTRVREKIYFKRFDDVRKCRQLSMKLYHDGFSQQINSPLRNRLQGRRLRASVLKIAVCLFNLKIYSEKFIFLLTTNLPLVPKWPFSCWAMKVTSVNPWKAERIPQKCMPCCSVVCHCSLCPHPWSSWSHRSVVIFSEHNSLTL